jgi:hypothetical protein
MAAGQALSPRKLQVPMVLARFSSKARLLLCAMSVLLILAGSFAPVYGTEPVVTGVSLTNHPGTGNASPFMSTQPSHL